MKLKILCLTVFALAVNLVQAQQIKNSLRAPAYPLVTIDPNVSAWSYSNNLYDSGIVHWSDKPLPFLGVLKVGNEFYRFMGVEELDLSSVVPNGEDQSWDGKYSTKDPGKNWFTTKFDDSQWMAGKGAFGTTENENLAKTNWTTDKIWVRREVTLTEDLSKKTIYLEYSHDDDTEIYINGHRVIATGGTGKNKRVKLTGEALKSLKKGKNIIAAYCFNGGANGFLDFGLFREHAEKAFFAKTAKQISADVQPMQTHYVFECGEVQLKITFTAPVFLDNLDLIGRPVNYLSYEITSNNVQDVQIYLEASPNWALHLPTQLYKTYASNLNGISLVNVGAQNQNFLERKGDHVRNDWGYFYLASLDENAKVASGTVSELRNGFIKGKKVTDQGMHKIALSNTVSVNGTAKGKIAIGYDDVYAIKYFDNDLRPYWNRNGNSNMESLLKTALKEYDVLKLKADQFDDQFMQEYQKFGKEYAELCALAYRQSIAAHKLVVAPNGDLVLLSKENDSNGSIGTVDITYPTAPLFLVYNPALAKATMNFIFYYSESGKWTKPFAAHDIGTYPVANGQTYGGDMPLEESGNMLILSYAIARVEKNAEYAKQHWNVLSTWADYLVENGQDPENQLCTDDFAGHFAHNANLSAKAIMGVASYGYLANMLGREEVGKRYIAKAREMAKKWKEMAKDGDHYKLTFDKSGTWSQKYNLVWDKILDMNIFDEDIIDTEINYYLTKQNKYGLPLDSREAYTKTDWIIWTATMAKTQEDFEKFIKPVHLFMNESTTRVPMSDWTWTDRPERRGFKARAVVGGYFIKMLEDKLKK